MNTFRPASQGLSQSPRNAQHERHFNTDHLMADLKGRSVRGGAITVGSQGTKFALHVISTAALARLLTPEDFGLIAMVTAVTGFVSMFKDAGLTIATVQRDKITHEQVSTLFWINVGISVVLMAITAGLSPGIAWFYDEPRLVLITLALAVTLLLAGLAAQHQALLKRQMRFTALGIVSVASFATGSATAIVFALLGAEYWALVAMVTTEALATTLLVWILSAWNPGLPRRRAGVRAMVGFGAFLSASNFLAYVRRNIDNVLIGALWGPASLGLYQKAYQLLLLPIGQINAPISAVAVPALSRLQNDPDKYRRYYRTAIFMITTIGMPIVGLALIDAEDIILLVLGSQWHGAVPIFAALVPAAFAGTMNVAGGWLFVSMGRTDHLFYVNLIVTPVVLLGMVCGIPWGVLGVAIGFSIMYCVSLSGVIFYATRISPVTIGDVLKSIWIAGTAAILSGSIVKVLGMASPGGLNLAIDTLVFSVSYSLCWMLLQSGQSRENAFKLFLTIFRSSK